MEFFEKAIWPNIPACEANSAGGGGNICVDRAYTVKIFIFLVFFVAIAGLAYIYCIRIVV